MLKYKPETGQGIQIGASKDSRVTPTQARAKRTVENIKATTIKLLSKQRYQNITTNQIAREANISIGSLYKYFPNKEALLADIAKDLINQASQIVKASVNEHHDKRAKDLFLLQISRLSMLVDPKNTNLSFLLPIALQDRSVYHLMIDQLADSVLLYLAHNKDVYPVENPELTAKTMSMAAVAVVVGFIENEEDLFSEEVQLEVARLIEGLITR